MLHPSFRFQRLAAWLPPSFGLNPFTPTKSTTEATFHKPVQPEYIKEYDKSSDSDYELDEDDSYEMTQRSYGTTAPETNPALPDGEIEVSDESRALLGRAGEPQNKPDSKKDGHATLVSCISNLLNTIIGSGAYLRSLSLEWGFLTTNVFIGMLTFPLVHICYLSCYFRILVCSLS